VSEIEPGWYKDPAEPTTQRYWDGEGWIGDPLPIDATPPPGPPQPTAPPRGTAPTIAPTPRPVPPGAAPGSVPPPPGSASRPPGSAPPPGTGPAPGTAPPGHPAQGTAAQSEGPVSLWPGGAVWPPGTPPGVPLPPGVHWVGGMPFVLARPRPHGLPVAPLGLRCLARVIDFGVVLGLNVLANGWLVYLFLTDFARWFDDYTRAQQARVAPELMPPFPDRAVTLMVVIPIIAALIWLVYEVPAIAQRGQTFGKRVVGVKVVALESTEPLGVPRALRRWNPLGLPTLMWTCGLGFILQLVDAISPCLGGPLHLAS